MNTTSSVRTLIKDPIGNRIKTSNPIANSQLVDHLLIKHSELIDPLYIKWFAGRFYSLGAERVDRCASEAKADGKNPRRLFAFLVKKNGV